MGLPAFSVEVRVDMAMMTCGECGIVFHVPETWRAERKKDGWKWYCPNGHSRVYRKTELDELREQLEAAKRDADWQRQRLVQTEKQLTVQRGLTTRYKRRIKNGVCPCCKRSFENVRRHMETKHPEFAEAGGK